MKVQLCGQMVELTDQDLLGVGGEASVYRHQGKAVKIYHPVDPKSSQQEKDTALKILKMKQGKLQQFPKNLPPQVVAPLDLVQDPKGQLVGFTMPIVDGATDVLRLSQRKWREGLVSNEEVTALFRGMYGVLDAIHQKGVVIGDFNDSNVLFKKTDPTFIDVDSMQFAGFPCVVGHERFMDPRLYGVDLTASCQFTKESDWYSFAVMLFGCLLYVHPYGGVHSRYPTLLRRAEARHSVLRDDVVYPKGGVSYKILPDELLGWFEKVFDKDERSKLPERLLHLRWTRCSCGAEHARTVCPVCAQKAPAREPVRFQGKCRQVSLFKTRGHILAAVLQGKLRYLYEEDGVVRREDGGIVLGQGRMPGVRYAIAGASTWVGMGQQLARIEREQAAERAMTGQIGGLPMFDAGLAGLYRLQDEWLMDGNGLRVGKILEGQTWFQVGERLGFGFYRAGLLSFYFLFKVGRPGLSDVRLPAIEGRLLDAAAVFDDKHALFLLATEKDGRLHNAMYLIRDDGVLVAQASEAADGSKILATIHGKALLGGRVVCSTEQGLMSLKIEHGQFLEGMLFGDTEPFVQSGAELLPGPDGSIYVVTTKEIAQVSLA